MVTNIARLEKKMKETGTTKDGLARELHIDPATLYRKLKAGGEKITVGEVHGIMDVLGLTVEECNKIFLFDDSGAKRATVRRAHMVRRTHRTTMMRNSGSRRCWDSSG